jgi:hypothetical protein
MNASELMVDTVMRAIEEEDRLQGELTPHKTFEYITAYVAHHLHSTGTPMWWRCAGANA